MDRASQAQRLFAWSKGGSAVVWSAAERKQVKQLLLAVPCQIHESETFFHVGFQQQRDVYAAERHLRNHGFQGLFEWVDSIDSIHYEIRNLQASPDGKGWAWETIQSEWNFHSAQWEKTVLPYWFHPNDGLCLFGRKASSEFSIPEDSTFEEVLKLISS